MTVPQTANEEKPTSITNDAVQVPKRPFDMDAILDYIGFGWFQIKTLAVMSYGFLFPGAAVLIYGFLAASPPARCFVDGCDDPANPQFVARWMDNTTRMSLLIDAQRPQALRRWTCAFQNLQQNLTCAADYKPGTACTDWIYYRGVISSSITTDFDLVCNDAWKVTFTSFLTLLGVLTGTVLLGPLCDLIGRRKASVFCTVWMVAFGIGSAFSPNWEAFASIRFFIGVAGQAGMMSFMVWGIESMPPSKRLMYYCGVGLAATTGNCLSGLAAYYIRDWSNLQLAVFVPFSLMTLSYFLIPESARWLIVKGRYVEARKIIIAAGKMNKREIPPEFVMLPDTSLPPPTKEVEAGDETSPPPANDPSSAASNGRPFLMVLEILKRPCLVKRIFILFVAWFAQMFLHYGLSFSATNLSTEPYLNYILIMLVDYPAILSVFFTANRIGRRPVMNVGLLVGGSFMLVAGLVDKKYVAVTITFSVLGRMFAAMFGTANYIISVELFPTASRGMTLAMVTTGGKIGSIISPYIAALGLTDPTLPYIIFGSVSLFAGFLTVLLPETKGISLPVTVQEAVDLESIVKAVM